MRCGPEKAARRRLHRRRGIASTRRADERALSLLEVTVAMALLASGVMATTSAIDASARAAGSGRYRTAATAVAERELEVMRSLDYELVGVSAAAPGFTPTFDGATTVVVEPGGVRPSDVVTEEGIDLEVRRHVTWAAVTSDDGYRVDDAYKRLTVEVEWFDHGTRRVRLDAGISPFTQPPPCAQPWIDADPGVVSGVVNTYWAGRADAMAGASRLALEPPIGAPDTLATGDLVIVIQMGGPDAGRYEYAVATAASTGGPSASGFLGVSGLGPQGGLLHPYDAGDGYQVVAVPTYPHAVVSGLTGTAWNGRAGGVVAVDVTGDLALAGDVHAGALGLTSSRPGGFTVDAAHLLPGGGSSGSPGGGLVLIRSRTISGSGSILAGAPSDGGTVVLAAAGDASGVTALAWGGRAGGSVMSSSPLGGTDVSGTPAGTVVDDLATRTLPGVTQGAGCRPAVTVTKTTSTPVVSSTGGATASYTIELHNAPARGTASAVTVTDLLPEGFSYAFTSAVELTGGAAQTSDERPSAGDRVASWGTFDVPADGTVRVRFSVSISAAIAPGTVGNDVHATYVIPDGMASADYLAVSSAAEDVRVEQFDCAVPWVDPAPAPLSGVINTYLPGTAPVATGATQVPVGAPTGMSTSVAAGDLVLVVQMSGASINATNNNRYGDGVGGLPASGATDLGATGTYEYAVATGPVIGGWLPVSATGPAGGLLHAYEHAVAGPTSGARRYQVVRVPTYPDARLDFVLARPWDGSTGGVVALDVAGVLDLAGGTIHASAAGFRSGVGRDRGTSASPFMDTWAGTRGGGGKGEGLAGTPRFVWDQLAVRDTSVEGLPGGAFGTGAPANAGGGGPIGGGAGGGANGGAGGTGSGGPGNGRGGSGGAASGIDPTRLRAGGGGGGSQQRASMPPGSTGGVGGGLVLLRAAGLAGSGAIEADGGAGSAGTGTSSAGTGGGGGGAGGTVVVATGSSSLDGLTVSARGGAGGASPAGLGGGGGGGGVVHSSRSIGAVDADGGSAGPTTPAANRTAATVGAGGVVARLGATAVSGEPLGVGCRSILHSVATALTPTVVAGPGASVTWWVQVTNLAGRPAVDSLRVALTLPTGMSLASTSGLVLGGGAVRTATTDPTPGDPAPEWGDVWMPGGGSATVQVVAVVGTAVPGRHDLPVRFTGMVGSASVAGGDDGRTGSGDDVVVTP